MQITSNTLIYIDLIRWHALCSKLKNYLYSAGMKMKSLKHVLAIFSLVLSTQSMASVIVLDFEKIAAYPNNSDTLVQGFYNGGTSSNGSSGTNYGVEFSSNALAICLNTLNASCSNTSRGGLGNPESELGGLFFLTGSNTFMNVTAGFKTGFSFLYSAINQTGSVSVYDGLNGAGNLLANVNLQLTSGTCPGYNAGFCPFSNFGVAFNGIARSVAFSGVANQIVFDDVTFGSTIAGDPGITPVPAPTPLALMGLGLLAILRKSKR